MTDVIERDEVVGEPEGVDPSPVPWSRRLQAWRSPADQPAWARPALLVVTALAAFSYSWRVGSTIQIYYGAAVRSMAQSWHNFFYGAFDPAGTVTVDKLPGALWVQALFVRLFGFNVWSLILPQAIEGALTVLVLYRVVRRLGGPASGILAAVVLAASPATVTLDRGNVPDTLMILLLVLAADSTRHGHRHRALAPHRAGRRVGGPGLPGQDARGLVGAACARPGLSARRARDARGPGRAGRRDRRDRRGALPLVHHLLHPDPSLAPPLHGREHEQLHLPPGVLVQRLLTGRQRVTQRRGRALLGHPNLRGEPAGAEDDPVADVVLRTRHRVAPPDGGRGTGRHSGGPVASTSHRLAPYRRGAVGNLAGRARFLLHLQHDDELVLLGCPLARRGRAARDGWRAGLEAPPRTRGDARQCGHGARHRGLRRTPPPGIGHGRALGAQGRRRRARPDRRRGADLGGLAHPPGEDDSAPPARWTWPRSALSWVRWPSSWSHSWPARPSWSSGWDPSTPPSNRRSTRPRTSACSPRRRTRRACAPWSRPRRGTPWLAAAQTSSVAGQYIFATGDEVVPLGGYTGTTPWPSTSATAAMVARGDFSAAVVATPRSSPGAAYIAEHCSKGLPVSRGFVESPSLRLYFCGPGTDH